MAQGTDILASQYNNIRSNAEQILGTGSGSSGYGQVLTSPIVADGNIITAAQWQSLRNDIISIRLHQDGNIPTITDIVKGTPIRFGPEHPNTQWISILDQAFSNRFNIGIGRSILTAPPNSSTSRTGSWSTQSQCTLTVTFDTSEQARFFFNSGGKIRFTSTRTGGAPTAQNNAWSNILNTVGTYEFTGNTSTAENFYTLTTSYRTVLNRTLTTPYSANFYRIEAKANVNNSTGIARILDFRITWRDAYIDPDILAGRPSDLAVPPGDVVDGTLSIVVEELKAFGNLTPSGSFNISSPIYDITSITAT
jgi:hypothetical protein